MTATEQTLRHLQNLSALRQQLTAAEKALQELTPEERLLAQMLFLAPQPGNVDRLCALLQIEKSSIYRRRTQVLAKLTNMLFPP